MHEMFCLFVFVHLFAFFTYTRQSTRQEKENDLKILNNVLLMRRCFSLKSFEMAVNVKERILMGFGKTIMKFSTYNGLVPCAWKS